MENAITPGNWMFACDRYGKVQHSKKACVFTTVKGPGGERLVNIAQRIENWQDAKLLAAAPDLLTALKGIVEAITWGKPLDPQVSKSLAAIAKAEGREI